MTTYETLRCEGCYWTWERPVVRGRKPRLCPSCTHYVKLPTAPKKPTGKVEITDGGRSDNGFTKETNDCTVRALAVATDSSYAHAHAFLKKNGRKLRKGVHFQRILSMNNYRLLGCTLHMTHLSKAKGLKTSLLRNPQLKKGTWILHMTHHVAVLKDGVLLDSFDSSRKTIDGAWLVTPATAATN